MCLNEVVFSGKILLRGLICYKTKVAFGLGEKLLQKTFYILKCNGLIVQIKSLRTRLTIILKVQIVWWYC